MPAMRARQRCAADSGSIELGLKHIGHELQQPCALDMLADGTKVHAAPVRRERRAEVAVEARRFVTSAFPEPLALWMRASPMRTSEAVQPYQTCGLIATPRSS